MSEGPDKARQDSWRMIVRLLLAQSYGTEDIAIKTNTDVGAVRAEVRRLRDADELHDILAGDV